jgi:purine-binding chemotaxis protein CheW
MSLESQWVTFRVGAETFGFEIQYVKEMLRMPGVHSLPSGSNDNLGVILLREEVIPVFDLRQRFGMDSQQRATDEMCELLRARRKDHENWLEELRLSVKEQREFSLTTDPHQCKFGKWYDSFKTDDPMLTRILARIAEPHREIHHLGQQVVEQQRQGNCERCRQIIDRGDSILNRLMVLFDEAIAQVMDSARQSLIVVGTAHCVLGVAVDEIQSVVRCHDEEIQAPDGIPGSEQFGGLIGLLPQKGNSRFIMLLDPAQIYPQLVAAM